MSAALAVCTTTPPAVARGQQPDAIADLVWTGGERAVVAAARQALTRPAPRDSIRRALEHAATNLMWTGHPAVGRAVLRLAIDRWPEAPSLHRLDSDLLLHLGQIDSAAAVLEAAVRFARRAGRDEDATSWAVRARELRGAARFTACNGVYRDHAGELIFKFDPYRLTGTQLLDLTSGVVRSLRYEDEATFAVSGGSGRVICEPGDSLRLNGPDGDRHLGRVPLRAKPVAVPVRGGRVEGTLYLPGDAADPAPAIILAPGAGLATRYNVAAEAMLFAAQGVAAFAWDKPGLGLSRWPGANWLLLSVDDQVEVVLRATDALRSRADVDSSRIGLWGFSQGGWVVPLAAARSPVVRFAVLVSAAAVPPLEQQVQWLTTEAAARGLDPDVRAGLATYLDSVIQSFRAGVPVDSFTARWRRASESEWGRALLGSPAGSRLLWRPSTDWELEWWRGSDVDPVPALQALDIPLLAIFGARDLRVPPALNLPLLARHTAQLPDRQLVVLPGVGHQLTETPTGRWDDQSDAVRYDPRYFRTMTAWLRDRVARR